ncbi:MAG: hypothetical protein RIB32_00400 [Phycisphaerales bacterium]
MHILTKVFVLFASILSVLVAALAISYTVSADRIVQDYQNAQQAKVAAETALSSQQEVHSRETTTLNATIDQLRIEKSQLASQLRENESTIANLTIAERQAKASRDSIEGKIAQLTTSVDTLTQLTDNYKAELQLLRAEQLRWRDEKIDLEGSLSDLSSQVIVYEATQRNLEEQLAEAKSENAKLRGGGGIASAGPRTSFTEVPGAMVRGRVEAVQPETATGDLIVQISLGSNDRIRENSRLYLNRDGREYLGDLHIFEVDLNHAFGRVVNKQPGLEVRAGDQVWSKLSNG